MAKPKKDKVKKDPTSPKVEASASGSAKDKKAATEDDDRHAEEPPQKKKRTKIRPLMMGRKT